MRTLLTSVAAVALVMVFAADSFANPKVKFSTDSDASVDGNSILSGNVGGAGGDPSGPGGDAVNVGGSVNFESFNTDIEVITNKELGVSVADISFVLNAAPGGPGTSDTNTLTFTCEDSAECTGTISTGLGTPTGGAGGSASFTTGNVAMNGTCRGFCNWVGNTGFANAIVAETASSIFAKVGSGAPNSTP